MNYNEAVEYIYGLRKFLKDTGRIRAKRALELLGNPQEGLKVIHVAGTNGKGSVCAYINQALIGHGYSVGLFTSPHLVKVNERIRINNENISDQEFLEYFNRTYETSKKMEALYGSGLAFFDFVCVMAVLYFKDNNLDYAIFETGMGGAKDATAALTTKLISIITSISLDHTEILGNTIKEIATEKAGIIGDGIPVVFWRSDEIVGDIMENAARYHNSLSYSVDKKMLQKLGIDGKSIDFCINNSYYKNNVFTIRGVCSYQVENAALALVALSIIATPRPLNMDILKRSVYETLWEGRMEELMPGIYVDGAHNPDGIERFLETVVNIPNTGRRLLLFGAVCDKDYTDMIKRICESHLFEGFIITQINNGRVIDARSLGEVFEKYTDKEIRVIADNKMAFEYARSLLRGEDVLLCAGSLYLVGAIKEIIGEI